MKKIILTVLILALLSGCGSAPPEVEDTRMPGTPTVRNTLVPVTPTVRDTLMPTATKTKIPTYTPRPTATYVPPTLTPTPINLNTLPMINYICPEELLTELPADTFPGQLVYYSSYDSSEIVIWDLENDSRQRISGNLESGLFYTYASISPDGNWLGYIESSIGQDGQETNLLIVTSNPLERQIEYELPRNWNYPLGPTNKTWINNTTIMLFADPGEMVLFDPFSLSHTQISLENFLSINPTTNPLLYWGDGYYVIDPSGQYLINTDGYNYFVWDIHSPSIINEIEAWEYQVTFHGPVWSPEGSNFLIAGMIELSSPIQDEFFLFDVDGNIQKLSSYSSIFPNGQEIRSYNWSPDGTKIAFSMRLINEPYTSLLGIFFVETGETNLYCVTHNDFAAPVWTPDSEHVLAVAGVWSSDHQYTYYLVDIENGTIFTFASEGNEFPAGYYLQGWLN